MLSQSCFPAAEIVIATTGSARGDQPGAQQECPDCVAFDGFPLQDRSVVLRINAVVPASLVVAAVFNSELRQFEVAQLVDGERHAGLQPGVFSIEEIQQKQSRIVTSLAPSIWATRSRRGQPPAQLGRESVDDGRRL